MKSYGHFLSTGFKMQPPILLWHRDVRHNGGVGIPLCILMTQQGDEDDEDDDEDDEDDEGSGRVRDSGRTSTRSCVRVAVLHEDARSRPRSPSRSSQDRARKETEV